MVVILVKSYGRLGVGSGKVTAIQWYVWHTPKNLQEFQPSEVHPRRMATRLDGIVFLIKWDRGQSGMLPHAYQHTPLGWGTFPSTWQDTWLWMKLSWFFLWKFLPSVHHIPRNWGRLGHCAYLPLPILFLAGWAIYSKAGRKEPELLLLAQVKARQVTQDFTLERGEEMTALVLSGCQKEQDMQEEAATGHWGWGEKTE